jgi:putative DNA primase/helicase
LRCEVHYEKCRGFYGADAKPFEVKMETGIDGAAIWMKRDLEDVVAVNAAELFQGGATVRQVAEQLGISKSRAGVIKKRRNRYEGTDVRCNTHDMALESDSEDRDE